MNERNVYLIFTNSKSLLSRVIGLYTKSEYNHVSITLDSNFETVYSFGRKHFSNPFIAGFVRENLQDPLFQKSSCIIYKSKITLSQKKQIQRTLKHFTEREQSYRYNVLGLFGVLLSKIIPRKKAFFCSQFVAYVLLEADIVQFDKALELTIPKDIEQNSKFRCIYKGKISSLLDT